MKQAEEARKDAVFCAGIVAAAVYNVFREKGDEPIKAMDFLPDDRPDLTEEEIADQAAAFFESLDRKHKAQSKRAKAN